MRSIYSIFRLNAAAAANAEQIERKAKRQRKPNCDHPTCNRRSDRSFLVYDIFSEAPKDALKFCRHHLGLCADPARGYFLCSQCARIMVRNYAWEVYSVERDGKTVCLRCAAAAHFNDPQNWIEPRQVKSVIVEPHGGPLFDSGGEILNVARCPRVLSVNQPLPAGVEFFENAEFGRTGGIQISGRHLLDTIQHLDEPFVPVLDADYQFAVSIGLYVRAADSKMRKEAA
jgi:hypothetical protein